MFDQEMFRKRLAAIRKEKGYSQEELAARIGVSMEFISKLERGVKCPSIDMIILLAMEFNVPTDYFLLRDDIREKQKEEIVDMLRSMVGMVERL